MITVGKVTSGTPGRESALLMLLDDDLTRTPIIRVWSNSAMYSAVNPVQEATDVATTVDGGIFVTGFISAAFSQGGWDCFVLRLNYTMDIIWAKSFGTGGLHEQCYSIKVTRNYDYFYVGGIQYITTTRSMIFYKFEAYGDSGITTTLTPTGTDSLSLRRILMT